MTTTILAPAPTVRPRSVTTTPVIDIADLSVHYGSREIVHDLSLTINRGEVFGLLGPNGAGKTTTLAAIQGLIRPTGGTITVDGIDALADPMAVRQRLGVQLQKSAFFPLLTLAETVTMFGALYQIRMSKDDVAALLTRFGLGPKAKDRPGQLSGGQLQRLALALAVVNDPQVILLDEPTTALDPQARRGIWGTVERLRDKGRTIVLTTHSMEEAQTLCDRVGIIDAGRLVALGTPAELIAEFAPPLSPAEAARREPNLEDVFLALAGRQLVAAIDEDLELAADAA